MRLRIVTPLSVTVDCADAQSVRAEDASGGFGILPGHADFLTSLTISVVGWRTQSNAEHYCAVRGGVLSVDNGGDVTVATREAAQSDDLAELEKTVLDRFRADLDMQRTEHVESMRLQLNAIRQIMRSLRRNGRSDVGRFG